MWAPCHSWALHSQFDMLCKPNMKLSYSEVGSIDACVMHVCPVWIPTQHLSCLAVFVCEIELGLFLQCDLFYSLLLTLSYQLLASYVVHGCKSAAWEVKILNCVRVKGYVVISSGWYIFQGKHISAVNPVFVVETCLTEGVRYLRSENCVCVLGVKWWWWVTPDNQTWLSKLTQMGICYLSLSTSNPD